MFLRLVLVAALLPTGMVSIPAGSYRPLYGTSPAARTAVGAFALDRAPVTRRAFLAFVRAYPQWQRDAVPSTKADEAYLADWPSARDAGPTSTRDVPVTSVSWYAATAYCEAQGKRLPSLDEWEYAVAEHHTRVTARGDGVWEWVADFDGKAAPTPEHAVHRDMTDTANADHRASCASGALGATDPTNFAAFQRFALRSALTRRASTRSLGFRCASSAAR